MIDDEDAKAERIEKARLQKRARFLATSTSTPQSAQGSGPPNRHGLPKLPVGQRQTQKWPVLDLGRSPKVSADDHRLRVCGHVDNPLDLSIEELRSLPNVVSEQDFHCVTTWSRMDLAFEGVRVAMLLKLAKTNVDATHLMCHGADGYSTNIAIGEASKPDVLLALSVDGESLPREHGGPLRMVVPHLYAWKGAKWITEIEVMLDDKPGYWEERGYSMTADPWREERYRPDMPRPEGADDIPDDLF